MEIIKTNIEGVVIIEPRIFKDDRGYFFESFSQREFEEKVCKTTFVQDNESKSSYGVLRGLHFQKPPFAQSKLVRVIKGAVLDVVSDASTETVLYADMPIKVQMKVTYTEPGIKGDTATNTLKPATVETGAEVRVPLFINEGEVIEINTTDGSYVGRIRE